MTDTPETTPPAAPASPVYQPPGGAAAPAAAPVVAASAAASTGAATPAPHSDMTPGHGVPLVQGPPNSVRGPMSAAGLNIGFLVAGIVMVSLAALLVWLVIHAIFH